MLVGTVRVGAEPVDAGAREPLNRRPLDGILQSRERGLRPEGRASIRRDHLERRIVTESVGVVDVLVPRGNLIQPLTDERVQFVRDVSRVAGVCDSADHIGAEPELLIELADEQQPGIRRERAAGEIDDEFRLESEAKLAITLCSHRTSSVGYLRRLNHREITTTFSRAMAFLLTICELSGLVVRLAPGVSRATATADLNVAFQQYLAGDKTLSDRARAQGFKSLDLAPASSGLSEFRDRYGKPVRAMLAIVSLLLVMGCANLASLFLARAAARQRDHSVCLAFGASRTRLARQVLSEILFISMAGGALGVLAASWGVDVLVGFLPDVGVSAHLEIGADRTVLLFGLCATLLTGLCIGLAPALLARRVDIRNMLSAGGRTVGFGAGAFKTFIVVQVALSTVLVVAATLFAVSLSNLKTQRPPMCRDTYGLFQYSRAAAAPSMKRRRASILRN